MPRLFMLLAVLSMSPADTAGDDGHRARARAAFAFELARLKTKAAPAPAPAWKPRLIAPYVAPAPAPDPKPYIAPPAGVPGGARFAEDAPRYYYYQRPALRLRGGGCST